MLYKKGTRRTKSTKIQQNTIFTILHIHLYYTSDAFKELSIEREENGKGMEMGNEIKRNKYLNQVFCFDYNDWIV